MSALHAASSPASPASSVAAEAPPTRLTQFRRTTRGETIKATTTRTLALSLLAATIVCAATALSFAGIEKAVAADSPMPPAYAGYALVFTTMPVLLVWAASLVLGELRNGVLRETHRAVPDRGAVLGAKMLLAVVVTVISAALLWILCHAVNALILGQPGILAYVVSLGGLGLLARLALVVGCWAVIAVATASLLRSLPLTLGVLLALYLFVEAYLLEIPGLGNVLPFASGKAFIPEIGGVTLASPALAGAGQVLITAVIAAIAWAVAARRDDS